MFSKSQAVDKEALAKDIAIIIEEYKPFFGNLLVVEVINEVQLYCTRKSTCVADGALNTLRNYEKSYFLNIYVYFFRGKALFSLRTAMTKDRLNRLALLNDS